MKSSLMELNITANEEMLKQVWINLIDNAIKFSRVGGIVSLDLNQDEKNVIFKISNGGETIKEEEIAKIFEKFYRGGESGSDGHGIGLSIVKKIVQLHRGTISVGSDKDLTEFTISLPKNC